MTVFQKNGIEVSMPEDDAQTKQNMIVAADFMARMIQKYGKKVLAKIEAKERAEARAVESSAVLGGEGQSEKTDAE